MQRYSEPGNRTAFQQYRLYVAARKGYLVNASVWSAAPVAFDFFGGLLFRGHIYAVGYLLIHALPAVDVPPAVLSVLCGGEMVDVVVGVVLADVGKSRALEGGGIPLGAGVRGGVEIDV